MGVLLGLAPFIAFFVLMRAASPLAGLVAALAVSVALWGRTWRRGDQLKVLDIGSLALFAILTVYTLVAAPAWTVATVRLAVDGGLLLIVLISLAIGRPFTLQYAREQVPQQYWNAPRFIAVNRLITSVWAGAFAVMVAADAAAEYVPAIPLAAEIAATVLAFAGAVAFTLWYPARVRRQTGVAAP
jgi:hypothetical protein